MRKNTSGTVIIEVVMILAAIPILMSIYHEKKILNQQYKHKEYMESQKNNTTNTVHKVKDTK